MLSLRDGLQETICNTAPALACHSGTLKAGARICYHDSALGEGTLRFVYGLSLQQQ